ncbi:MAG: hypothetical protein IKP60_05445 [Treponema sp.]|nr:hypothetical protein [Treponema sp.]
MTLLSNRLALEVSGIFILAKKIVIKRIVMDEAAVKTFLGIKAGETEETFASFMAEHGNNLEAAIAEYLENAVDAGSKNGSAEYSAWCSTTAKDIIAGKYATLADVQTAADTFASC